MLEQPLFNAMFMQKGRQAPSIIMEPAEKSSDRKANRLRNCREIIQVDSGQP